MVRICNCAVLAVLLILSSVSLFASTDQSLAIDQVRSAIAQPDGASVSLQAVFVDNVIGQYAFVRDTFGGRVRCSLPVYLKNFIIKKDWTLDITGIMATVGSRRVLVAREISVYTDIDGKEFCTPFPFRAGDEWPYIKNAEAGISIMDADPTLPPVPESEPVESEPLTASPGTVAYVKLDGGEVDLTGKLVTAVFYTNDLVSFFYIQEPVTGGNGIKVVPQVSIPVAPGNIVTIKGSLISGESSGEAYIYASSIKCTGSMKRPVPAGMTGRSAVGGEFGEQPALYLNTSSESPNGGLNPVGTRVRVWGYVLASATENGHAVRYISDGSGLITSSRTGLKVVYWNPSDAPGSQTYIQGVTGVLGAEIADGKPVPVVRVPDSTKDGVPGCVKYVTPNGVNIGCWTNCYSSVQAAINAANGCEIWVAAGTYSEYLNILDGVAIYGGFAGGETLREERNWSLHETILDGSTLQYGDIIAFAGESQEIRLDGFIIQYSKSTAICCGSGYAIIANNTIRYNSGSGIYVLDGCQLIYNNKITGNTASYGGGVYCSGGGAQIWDNDISSNTATYYGGGVYTYETNAQVLSNTITANTANEYGGGIYCYGSIPAIFCNTIKGNSAGYGGGIYCAGESGDAVRIVSNAIIENTGETAGAGIYSDRSCDVINNTVAWNGNETTDTGDGICLASTSHAYQVINNILAYNYGAGIRGVSGISIKLENNDCVGQEPYNFINVGAVSSSNISIDPAFVISPAHNIHIQETSPCRNAGQNSGVLIGDKDIDDETRIMDGTVDIGADEVSGCVGYTISFIPESTVATAGQTVQICAIVKRGDNDSPVKGVVVNFTINTGQITDISPEGSIDQGALSGHGVTGYDGKVCVELICSVQGYVNLTATVDSCGGTIDESSQIRFINSICDWPMFMQNEQHTGLSPYPDAAPETLTLAWQAEVQTATTGRSDRWYPHNQPGDYNAGFIFEHPYIDSSPVVVGNKVVVGTWARATSYSNATGSVVAFNGETGGSSLWTATGSPSMGGVASTPCIVDGKVYVGTTNGYIYCLDLATGSQIWAQPTYDRSSPAEFSKILASPVVHNGIVYIGNEAANVYAFDATTGALQTGYPVVLPIDDTQRIWERRITAENTKNVTGISSPAVAYVGNTYYLLFGCDDGYIYRITLGTSNPQATLVGVDLERCVESSPTVVGDKAYIGTSHYNGSQVFCLTINPLQILIKTNISSPDIGQECRATIAYDGAGFLYAGVDTGHTFHKMDVGTLQQNMEAFGSELENNSPDYYVGSAAICGNGLAYVGNDDGAFRALRISDLTEAVENGYPSGGIICSSPAIAYNVDSNHNRWVYVTTRDGTGKLLAFKTNIP